jgi:PAS domain S-box-containing protein
MDPIKISPLVLSLTGIAEKNPTSSKSMTESLIIITHDFGFQRAWVRFRMQNGQFADFEANGQALPESIVLEATKPFAHQERFRLFEADQTHWLTIPLREDGMLIFERDTAFRIGDQIDDFISYLIVYFNGMIEWHHREETDRELRNNHHLLDQIVNAIPEMLAFKDLSGRYLVANKKADEAFLHRFPTIVGKTVEDLYPQEEVAFIRSLDNEAIQDNQPLRREIDMMTDSGTIQVETIRVPVKDEDGGSVGIISMSRDISDKKKTEEKIQRFVAFQDTLMKIATHFINVPESKAGEAIDMALSLAGKHIEADRVYVFDYLVDQRIMNNTYEWCGEGISPEIANLQNVPMDLFLDNWVHPHERGESVYIHDVFALDPENTLYQVLTPQGIQSILTIPLIYQERLLGFVGFDAVRHKREWSEQDQSHLKVLAELIVNLKMRKEKEAELMQTRQKAEKANEAKSEFLSNMSHEIRTPLSGIYNALYLLYNTSLSPDQQEYVAIANTSIESLSSIVNNILDLAKIESGKIEIQASPFDLEEELYQIAKMEEYSAMEKGLMLLIDMDFSIPRWLIHDRLRLRQILLNLLHNAIKYTEKGFVELATKLVSLEDDRAIVRFFVKDSGIGIEPEMMPIITDKFVQGDSSGTKRHAGTGLGLAIVKHLVEQFGGTLQIESQVGKGSTFSFAIPISIDSSLPDFAFEKTKGKSLLRVDPIEATSDQPKRFFESLGMNVASTSSLALTQVGKNFDFILFESLFSDLDEAEISRLRKNKRFTNARFAVLSREPSTGSTETPSSKGVDAVLHMPTTRGRVYRQLTQNADQQEIVEAPMPESWKDDDFSGLRVLVVDDNRINRQALELILRRSGFLVTLAQNGYESIDLAGRLEFDLILMDIQMPGLDGYETTRRLRALSNANATVPIVAVTANALPGVKERALEAGMNEAIVKPVKPEQIFRLVEYYLNSKSIIRPAFITLSIPPELVVFHWTDFIARFEGMFDLAKQILIAFREDLPRDIKNIHEAVQSRDFANIRKTTHYMKGSAAYVGAERVVWVCQHMIDEAKASRMEDILVCDRMLDKEIDEWLNELKQYEQRGALN